MLSRNQVKQIQSLKQKKFRDLYHQFLVEGSKLVSEILNSNFRIISVYALTDWVKRNEPGLLSRNISCIEISEDDMARITALSSPSPALAIVEIPETPELPSGLVNDLVLVLDDIKDPGNLGTIIRIADWFGIDSIICSENTVELYNPKVVQATMGSLVRVKVSYADLPKFLDSLDSKVKIYGTLMEGENIYSASLEPAGIIIIGSESFGISMQVQGKITHKINIPSFSPGPVMREHAESLNASIATAIVCSEFRKRKT